MINRAWLLADIARLRTIELELPITQAADAGYTSALPMRTNAERRAYLTACRAAYWDGQNPGSGDRSQAGRRGRKPPSSLCEIPATEVNEWLRSLADR